MKLSGIALAVALALAMPAAVAAHPHDTPKSQEVMRIEANVLAARDAIKAAVGGKDVAALRALYAADFSHTHTTGKMDNRDARLVSLLSGDPVIETAETADLHVHVHGRTTAVVTGRSPIRSLADGKIHDVRWMQVFVQLDGSWRLAASQATRMPTPPTQ
jgi:ketosteroid isomerase-like protein